jgi:hypothetical protein
MRQPLLKPRFLLLLPFLAACAPAQDTFSGVQRIVAIGDIHGDYDRLVDLLRTAKLIDKQNAWAGGATHLVLDGDMVDRGPASRKVLDLVMALEAQAPSAGGAVHPLIGNHEAMDIIGDLRYVSKEDWESYRSPGSQKLLEAAAKSILDALTERGTPPPDAEAFLKDFLSQHPLGWVEQRLLFGPNGKYGKWLRQQNAIIKIDDSIFMHAGISPKYADSTRDEINRRVREELDDPAKRADGMITTDEGPLWYRDLVTAPEDQAGLAAHVDQVLKTQQAQHMIVGHSVGPAILPRFGGKVIAIDVGLSVYFKGPPEFLVIEGPRFFVICRSHRLDFPANGRGVPQYLRAVAAIDPGNSALQQLLQLNTR